MSELAEYEVTDARGRVTTVQLNTTDAKRLGARRVKAPPLPAVVIVEAADNPATVHNRARQTPDKSRRPGPAS